MGGQAKGTRMPVLRGVRMTELQCGAVTFGSGGVKSVSGRSVLAGGIGGRRVEIALTDYLAAAPFASSDPGVRKRIREANKLTGRRVAILDDDPTGCQTVSGATVLTVIDSDDYKVALDPPGAVCFVWTNSRALTLKAAFDVNFKVACNLQHCSTAAGHPMTIVSRGDSTLRGHVVAEVRAIDAARRSVVGKGYDGFLFVPAYFEAGRVTAGDVHWARVRGDMIPVGRTEFARDATFGFASSNLKAYLGEVSGGQVSSGDVVSISLEDIRLGGPARVAEILGNLGRQRWVVVNAMGYSDLGVVVLGLLAAEATGLDFLHRSAPSFIAALVGADCEVPVNETDLWPSGVPGGHGLVVVGSHVALTSRQVSVLKGRHSMVEVQLDVSQLLDADARREHVAEAAKRVLAALEDSDVLLITSRAQLRSSDNVSNLDLARTIARAVSEVVKAALVGKPRWIVAKGGITSHDVAVHGLGMRRATVIGQILPGMVSVLRIVEGDPSAVGLPYVVFPGNVGADDGLSCVVDVVRGVALC